jgi:hypothetical protein
MTDQAVDLTISPQIHSEHRFRPHTARDHLQTIVQIDLSEADLTRALQGREVLGALTVFSQTGAK